MNAIQPLRPASLLSLSLGLTISSKLFTTFPTLAEERPQTHERHPNEDIAFVIIYRLLLLLLVTLLANIADRRLERRRLTRP